MTTILKQSTAIEVKLGPFVDDGDGFTPMTALTIAQADVRLAKNGGDWAQKSESTTMVHEENGWYRCLLDTTDTNTLGILKLAINESGALPVWEDFHVVTANVYDTLFSTDVLDVSVTQWLGTAAATPTVAGVPEVDLTHVAGATTDVSALATNVAAILVDTGTTLQAEVDGIQADTEDIQARLPAALVGGRMDSSVGAMATDVVTAASLSSGAVEKILQSVSGTVDSGSATTIVDAERTETPNDYWLGCVVVPTSGANIGVPRKINDFNAATDTITVNPTWLNAMAGGDTYIILRTSFNYVDVDEISANVITSSALATSAVAEIADGVWDELLAGHAGAGSAGEALSAAGTAGDPWTTALPGAYGAGTAGFIIGTNIDAPISVVDTVVDAIKVKTDPMTYTVANQLDANTQSINDTTIIGNGSVGNEFRV